MTTTSTFVEQIELAHRRLARAKQLIEQGLMQVTETSRGPIYLCSSQTAQAKLYRVEQDQCPCEDSFQLEGRKLCKHILARLILEQGIDLKKINQDPCYWHERQVTP